MLINEKRVQPRAASADSSVLDFLRATAVSLVFVSHVMEATRNSDWYWTAQQLGWMGVMLFFVTPAWC
jgi:peptidoglycan/LPS O-acetylase OafA/YrhL